MSKVRSVSSISTSSLRRTVGRPAKQEKVVIPDFSEGIQTQTEDQDDRFNSALARGMALLRSFQPDERFLSNADLAERTGIPKATVSRLTYTLSQLGYLQYSDEFGKYEIAAGVLGLAYPYIAKQVVPAAARPLMLKLAEETKTTVGLGVQEGLSVLYLEVAHRDVRAGGRQRVGFRIPLVRTALGRACVAGMSPSQRQLLLRRMQQYYPKEWKVIWAELEHAIAEEESLGYCTRSGGFDLTRNAVAVPFICPATGSVMAFSSAAPSEVHTPAQMAKVGKQLLEMTRLLASQLPAPLFGRR